MKEIANKLVEILKQQAELFLLDAGQFFPFGTYINMQNEIIPVGAYFENDQTSSAEVIELLEKALNDHIEKRECQIAAIAIDVTIKENQVSYDAIELRFFEPEKEACNMYLKYTIKGSTVEFTQA
ncbi:hypothetical protein [Mucilaginibacter gotjawali]|uniref:Uncharacterized protein n=2 Tax=Mucilaginibacter gotjawali TaxID=1550579 RepID=A0A110B0Q7_9SPHI|nr:hypothetical protein [Mucilaginibacter gotjawali]MBB3057799.1 hypothetical protein [Mucilaginibacter gotjawali]BAU52601.1 hypothetical protein MgSA37_00763 [Mucilaginibacter gotjawali]